MKKPTKVQILEKVRRRFSDPKNRAMLNGSTECVYETPDGRNCAVGMFMEHPKQYDGRFQSLRKSGVRNYRNYLKDDQRQESLKPEYRGHEVNFWSDVQSWHDDLGAKKNFTKTGISAVGKRRMNSLKRIWKGK